MSNGFILFHIAFQRFFDPKAKTTLQCDASDFGFGGCLMSEGRPVRYICIQIFHRDREKLCATAIDRPPLAPVSVKYTTSRCGPHWYECRRRARLIKLFKLHSGIMVINTTRKPVTCFLPAEHSTGRNQFFPRTIVEWNALPSVTVKSAMVEAFKNQIDSFQAQVIWET